MGTWLECQSARPLSPRGRGTATVFPSQQKEEQLLQQPKQHQLNENSLRGEKQQKENELEEHRLLIRQLIDQQWKIEEKETKNNEEIVHEFREQSLKKLRKQKQKEKELKRTLEKKRLFLEQQKATKY